MSNLLFARASENVTSLAAITASAADSAYPASNLGDLNPANPAKLTATTGNWVFAFAAAQRVDVIALIHHNLTAGLSVRIQGNATNVWTSPTFDQALTIPAYQEDGFPVNPFLDLTGLVGYSTSGFQFWRLIVVGTNAANVAIGEVVLATTKRLLEVNIQWGSQDGETHPTIEHVTAGGVVRAYDIGVKMRQLVAAIDTTDVGYASILSLARDTRIRVRPFLIVPDPTVNDAWLVRLTATTVQRTLNFLDRNTSQLEFDELSRGLPL